MNHAETECCKSKYFLSPKVTNSDGSNLHSDFNTDERLQIFCSSCKNPLGLPENDLFVKCSLISTSKVHLMSLKQKILEDNVTFSRSSVDVLVTTTSYVNRLLYGAAREGASGQGIWCKEDGCVFNSIFCPFCVNSDNFLGVHIVATDASNTNFQNTILFYLDRLEIKIFETEIKISEGAKDKALSSHPDSNMAKNAGPADFEKFAYSSPSVQDSRGWRNTKSRMRLPRKG